MFQAAEREEEGVCCEGWKIQVVQEKWATKKAPESVPVGLGQLDSNQRMTESKSVALPLGYTPMVEGGRFELPNPKERIYSPPRLATSLPLQQILKFRTQISYNSLKQNARILPKKHKESSQFWLDSLCVYFNLDVTFFLEKVRSCLFPNAFRRASKRI